MAGAVLVTGGARRLGRRITLALMRAGFPVLAQTRAIDEGARRFQRAALKSGFTLDFIAADYLDTGGFARFLSDLHGRDIVGVVNNVSLFENDAIGDPGGELFARALRVNLQCAVEIIRACLPSLARNRGFAVNITDHAAASPTSDFFSYTVSKAALAAATETLAIHAAPHVRVNAVAPGLTFPNETIRGAAFSAAGTRNLLRKPVSPRAVADAVVVLARAGAITGQTLYVDSGERFMGLRRDPSAAP